MSDKPFLNRINPQGINKDKKSRVIFYGDSPTCATGFGQVSRNVLPALYNSGRYDVDVLGINYWGDPHEFPFRIWPMAINGQRDPYGRQRMQQHLVDQRAEYDILFFMQDTFILDFMPQLLSNLKSAGKNFKSVFYYPIDGIPKESWIRAAAAVDYPVTYSKFGYDQSVKLVPELEGRLQIIPHGVNPQVFYPAPAEDVANFRKQFFGPMADKFIFINVNRNQPRKDIPATIRAFKAFKEQRPDSLLYLHMAAVDQGWNLLEVIKSLGLDVTRDVILPQKFNPATGFPLAALNMIYNAADAVISTTIGEGFGLTWSEAMAVRKPVIFPNNTMLGEFITDETGFPYPSGGDLDHITILTNDNEVPRPIAHLSKMVERMIQVYDNREEAAKRAEAAYKMIHSSLIWDQHINPRWVSLFDSIIGEMGSTSSSAPVDISRPILKGEVL